MSKIWRGSCHCKAIEFTAVVDLSVGTFKCNCRLCAKQRMWKTGRVATRDFVLTHEQGALGALAGRNNALHHFCNRCGISTHTHVVRPERGEDYVLVQIAAFDDLPLDEVLAAPLTIVDGLHENWAAPPQETRHL